MLPAEKMKFFYFMLFAYLFTFAMFFRSIVYFLLPVKEISVENLESVAGHRIYKVRFRAFFDAENKVYLEKKNFMEIFLPVKKYQNSDSVEAFVYYKSFRHKSFKNLNGYKEVILVKVFPDFFMPEDFIGQKLKEKGLYVKCYLFFTKYNYKEGFWNFVLINLFIDSLVVYYLLKKT